LRGRKTFLGGIACAQPRTNDGSCVARLNAALTNIVTANTAPFPLLLSANEDSRKAYRKANERGFLQTAAETVHRTFPRGIASMRYDDALMPIDNR